MIFLRVGMSEEDDFFERVQSLDRSLSGDSEEGRFRAIARAEADNRVVAWVCLFGAIWLAVWLPDKLSLPNWIVGVGLVSGWIAWVMIERTFDPKYERHLIVLRAEDAVRLKRIAKAHDDGLTVWELTESDYVGTKKVNVREELLEGFWAEVFSLAASMDRLAPFKRNRVLRTARKAAQPALRMGNDLAKENGVELIYWAAAALDRTAWRGQA